MSNEIKNTSKNPNPEWLMGGNPSAIEHQEKQGQQELIHSDVLPVEIGKYTKHDEKEILESFGFKFLGIVKDDPLFQNVLFPKGWKIESTDHSMWNSLVDDKGRKRADIFYKAAFYDRKAHMNLIKRFTYRIDWEKWRNNIIVCNAIDQEEKIVFSVEKQAEIETLQDRYNLQELCEEAVKEWLDKNYPDWENPGKYWD